MSVEMLAFLTVASPVAFGVAVVHARFRPLRICPRCGGTGELGTGKTRAVCPKCVGTKRVRRILAPRT